MSLPLGARIDNALIKRALSSSHRQKYVPTDELSEIFTTAMADLEQSGVANPTYFEAGVFAGDSLATFAQACGDAGHDLRAFAADSFRGLPASVENDEGNWEQGQFRCPRVVTEWNLRRLGVDVDRVELIEGWFDETLTPELADRIGSVDIAMLDADSYSSTVPVLEFLAPLLADHAWLIFDDWYSGGNYDPTTGSSRGTGVERAFLEWRGRNPHFVVSDRGDYELEWRGNPRMAGKVFTVDRREP